MRVITLQHLTPCINSRSGVILKGFFLKGVDLFIWPLAKMCTHQLPEWQPSRKIQGLAITNNMTWKEKQILWNGSSRRGKVIKNLVYLFWDFPLYIGCKMAKESREEIAFLCVYIIDFFAMHTSRIWRPENIFNYSQLRKFEFRQPFNGINPETNSEQEKEDMTFVKTLCFKYFVWSKKC